MRQNAMAAAAYRLIDYWVEYFIEFLPYAKMAILRHAMMMHWWADKREPHRTLADILYIRRRDIAFLLADKIKWTWVFFTRLWDALMWCWLLEEAQESDARVIFPAASLPFDAASPIRLKCYRHGLVASRQLYLLLIYYCRWRHIRFVRVMRAECAKKTFIIGDARLRRGEYWLASAWWCVWGWCISFSTMDEDGIGITPHAPQSPHATRQRLPPLL